MRILSVVGARPQFIKLAAVAEAITEAGHEHVIVHTGQHYDDCLSWVFFADLKIPTPDVNLRVGSASHGVQTGRMLAGLDPVLDHYRPDWVLVYGDTNATVAGALAAVKQQLPLAHVEAGLRSHNRRMPEEHNRVTTDHLADLLLAPTRAAMDNLDREGLAGRARLVGDVSADILRRVAQVVTDDPPPVGTPDGDYIVATIHRAENTDDPTRLAAIVDALAGLPLPVVLPVHPRLAARANAHGIALRRGAIQTMPALPYPQMVRLVQGCEAVVTDSGGLQMQAYLLGRPCTTLRAETEWTETEIGGWNVCCPNPRNLAYVVTRTPIGPPLLQPTAWAARRVVEAVTR